jgi:hypothetical protein
MLKLEIASRKKAKMKLALQGPSGSGKTMGALLLAHGLCGNWESIAVIDTENRSAELYSHLGKFNVVQLSAPFTPEKFVEAIKLCETSGMQVIIIDSVSHQWDGSGGILDIHGSMAGNSFTNWAKVMPRMNAFVQAILQSPCHVIGTIRSKQDYVLTEKNGKQVPEKVGLKGITKEALEYEFTLVLDIDIKHNVTASKDRTQLFADKPEFKITEKTGRELLAWCEQGDSNTVIHTLTIPESTHDTTVDTLIEQCDKRENLVQLYKSLTFDEQVQFREKFIARRDAITNEPLSISSLKSSRHGNITASTR